MMKWVRYEGGFLDGKSGRMDDPPVEVEVAPGVVYDLDDLDVDGSGVYVYRLRP